MNNIKQTVCRNIGREEGIMMLKFKNKTLLVYKIGVFTISLVFMLTSCAVNGGLQENDAAQSLTQDDDPETLLTEEDYPEGNNDIIPRPEDKVLFRVGLSTHPNNIYYFVLLKNGVLEASIGSVALRHNNDLSDMLESVYQHDTVKLSESDFEYLLEMVDKIEKTTEAGDNWTFTGWGFDLYYNDISYSINYMGDPPMLYKNFIDQLLVLSPIDKPDFWDRRLKYIENQGYTPGRLPLED